MGMERLGKAGAQMHTRENPPHDCPGPVIAQPAIDSDMWCILLLSKGQTDLSLCSSVIIWGSSIPTKASHHNFFWYLFIVHTCATMCLWSKDNLWEMVLSFHHVSLGAQTHVLSFGSKGLSTEVSGGPLLYAVLNLLPIKPNRGVGKIMTMWNPSPSDLNHLPLVRSFTRVLKVNTNILLLLREHPGSIPSQSKEISRASLVLSDSRAWLLVMTEDEANTLVTLPVPFSPVLRGASCYTLERSSQP